MMPQPSDTTPPGELMRMSMVSSSSGIEAMNSSIPLKDTPSRPMNMSLNWRSSSGIISLYILSVIIAGFCTVCNYSKKWRRKRHFVIKIHYQIVIVTGFSMDLRILQTVASEIT